MTREGARVIIIEWLNKGKDGKTKERLGYLEGWFHDSDEEAFNMAIEALKAEPCEDAISRQAVINQIFYSTDNNGDVVLGSALRERIARLPSVTPQKPKTGHWLMTGDYYTGAYGTIDYVECSCCHEDSLEEGDYCPNCGAKMVEPQESEDKE